MYIYGRVWNVASDADCLILFLGAKVDWKIRSEVGKKVGFFCLRESGSEWSFEIYLFLPVLFPGRQSR